MTPRRAVASRSGSWRVTSCPAMRSPDGELPECVLELAEMELGGGGTRSWVTLACGLRDAHGPFVLAYLEALVRIADWRASG